MKNYRRIAASLIVMVLMFCFCTAAFASNAQLDHVTDAAEFFSEEQLEALEKKAEAISRKYNLGVYILVLDDFKQYSNTNSIERFAVNTYDEYELGYGSDHAGTMLILSMSERDYNLNFYGDRAHYAFTEAGRDKMEDRFLRYFRNNDFYGGFNEYLKTCEEYLAAAENGTPVGQGERSSADEESGGSLMIAIIVAGVVTLIVGISLAAPMHSAGEKRDANAYVVKGSMNLLRRSDMFLHRSVTRTPRQTSSSSSSGSGSHHYSSGGHSGRSGKF